MNGGKKAEIKSRGYFAFSIASIILYVVGIIINMFYLAEVYGISINTLLSVEQMRRTIPFIISGLFLVLHLKLYKKGRIQIWFVMAFMARLVYLFFNMNIGYIDVYEIMLIIESVACVGIIIEAFCKNSSRRLTFSLVCVSAVIRVVYFLYLIYQGRNGMDIMNMLGTSLAQIGIIFFYIACIEYLAVIREDTNVVKRNIASLEQMLVDIKQQYDSGIITEQEYQRRKESIMGKL